jgi:hypothetical protein
MLGQELATVWRNADEVILSAQSIHQPVMLFNLQFIEHHFSGIWNQYPLSHRLFRRPPELAQFLPELAPVGSITKCAEEPLLLRP